MPTFDEIFKRWVNKNELTQEDVMPILMEYVQTFKKVEFNPQIALAFAQMTSNQWINGQNGLRLAVNNALKMTGIKKGYHWAEVLDQQGNLLKRIWQPQDGKIQG
jgi:hypothetical protein